MTSILGGGLSGLSAAFYLLRRGVPGSKIKLYEASSRVGGWIRSIENEEHNITFECGPRTIRPVGESGKNTLALLEELKLDSEIQPILRSSPAAQRRLIYVNGQLHPLPSNFKGLLTKQSPFSRPLFYALFHDIFAGKSPKALQDESIYSFAKRRFGQEVADYAISPMICGICAGNAKEISVKFLMKDLFAKEQKYGGVVKAILANAFSSSKKKTLNEPSQLAEKAKKEKWSIYSLKGGLENLPKALENYLMENDVQILKNSDCNSINFSSKGVELTFKGGKEKADEVISALPSYKLAKIVKDQHPKLSEMLTEIPYVDVGVVNLHFSSPHALKEQGFGFLAAPREKIPILGVIFDSCCFDIKTSTVVTVMMGGHWFKEYFGDAPKEADFLATAQKYLKDILDIQEQPTSSRVNILKKCIPQYVLGHHDRVERIRDYMHDQKLPLRLCGAPYDGIGINDVIMSAKTAVNSYPSTAM
ncbi:protoporphyrinogen oxidase [Phlebotomus argentipes]|uniref:protoporphyrinogen oxidase n=1 Tax=Phlebotomus argentipes TaxID=94469 RepID=UPI002892F24C|nr:protoporphyrinogen oxidase [Phlebotomus argentipes]